MRSQLGMEPITEGTNEPRGQESLNFSFDKLAGFAPHSFAQTAIVY